MQSSIAQSLQQPLIMRSESKDPPIEFRLTRKNCFICTVMLISDDPKVRPPEFLKDVNRIETIFPFWIVCFANYIFACFLLWAASRYVFRSTQGKVCSFFAAIELLFFLLLICFFVDMRRSPQFLNAPIDVMCYIKFLGPGEILFHGSRSDCGAPCSDTTLNGKITTFDCKINHRAIWYYFVTII